MRALRSVVVLCVAVSGCGIGEGGTGLAHKRDGETYPGERQQLTGVVEGGPACWYITLDGSRYFVIWPAGSDDEVVDEEWGARLPHAEIVAPGDTVTGIGALTPAEPLILANAYWEHVFSLCDPDDREVVVFDSAERVR